MKQWCDNHHTEVLMQNFFKEVGIDPQ
jgi:hypothetical protein